MTSDADANAGITDPSFSPYDAGFLLGISNPPDYALKIYRRGDPAYPAYGNGFARGFRTRAQAFGMTGPELMSHDRQLRSRLRFESDSTS